MHEMSEESADRDVSMAGRPKEAVSEVPQSGVSGVPCERDANLAQTERLHQAERSRPDFRRTAGDLSEAAAEQSDSKVRRKWYRFIYRTPLMLVGITPPMPDQYHEYESDPGVFANWDVRGPFESEEEARRNGYENGYE